MSLLLKILAGILVVFIMGIAVLLYNYYSWRGDKLAELRSGSQIIETAAGPVEYVLKGNHGPVRLYFHGSPGGYDAGPDAGDDYRLLIPSRAGYLSTPMDVGKTWEEQADAYAALLDALKITQPVQVMGTSGGAPCAIAFAARYPQRTSALLLISPVSQLFKPPAPPGILQSDFTAWLVLSALTRFLDEGTLVRMLIQDPDSTALILKDPDKTRAMTRVLWGMWPGSLRNPGRLNDVEQFTSLPLTVDTITAPTLIMHGTKDSTVPIADSEKLAEQVSNATLYKVEGGVHWIAFTHREELDGVIKNFLVDHKVAPPGNVLIAPIDSSLVESVQSP